MSIYIKAFLFILAIFLIGSDAPLPIFYYTQPAGVLLLGISAYLINKGENHA